MLSSSSFEKTWRPWYYQCVSIGEHAHAYTVEGLVMLCRLIEGHLQRYGAGLLTEISMLLAADQCQLLWDDRPVGPKTAPCHHLKVLKEGSLVQADAIVKHLVEEGVLVSERSRNHRHGRLRLRPKMMESWFVPRAILLKDIEEQWLG